MHRFALPLTIVLMLDCEQPYLDCGSSL